ncbi:hypothetical protein [Erythrobacter cryptus]|uniref:hypothetical protein n=1 Tax=Erythrobacter cryptus TaxID=196588 RepID=UPI000683DD41|nr:hypothetical protein [Erythrobacter cryptus]
MALNLRVLALTAALGGAAFITAPASAATTSVTIPAHGAPPFAFDHSRYDPARTSADWRCWGWRCRHWGWGGGWGRRGWRRDRIDAGDVLIGAAIIGGIAAIASAENRRRERDVVVVERERYRRVPDDWRDRRAEEPRTRLHGSGARGLDNAVDQCLTRIERDVRVESVDGVERSAGGWRVSGRLFNGAPFQCRIGNGGQIDGIDYGDGFAFGTGSASSPRGDGQWSDARYADARAAIGGAVRPDLSVREARLPAGATAAPQPMPAYPGGPIPGVAIPETIDGDL